MQDGDRERDGERERKKDNLRANQPSSSSRLVGAGRGAPGPSWVGSLTPPARDPPNGLRFWMLSSREEEAVAVVAVESASLRLHPRELMESRKEADAILYSPLASCKRNGGQLLRF